MITIKPHHCVDILTALGDRGVDVSPHPYGHALHRVAQAILADRDAEPREATSELASENLSCPMVAPKVARWLLASTRPSCRQVPDNLSQLDVARLRADGPQRMIPIDGVLLILLPNTRLTTRQAGWPKRWCRI
jgi:hypothetical protein